MKIWDIASGQRLYTLGDARTASPALPILLRESRLPPPATTRPFTFGKLATTDGQLLHSLIADEDSILALAWTPDGKS